MRAQSKADPRSAGAGVLPGGGQRPGHYCPGANSEISRNNSEISNVIVFVPQTTYKTYIHKLGSARHSNVKLDGPIADVKPKHSYPSYRHVSFKYAD